ncbi:hypothetical protein K503DRAFT_215257 [Rhizopogon vinicolor AM-OR11-026]|uniref:Uncharacterized protein n=1 Tax=Rhizopogon vinicolor AM-OR11-026 TaxID=1314800 RepID=A0A1B7MYQ8_9AGAM|nr:hypothetical protein K503DRAFT_215257 [Rhizopogon vinicolor AM-OR11-026]
MPPPQQHIKSTRGQRQFYHVDRHATPSSPPSFVDRIPMQGVPDNAFLESSEGHQNIPHINTLVTLMLEKRSHKRSDSTVAIAPSVMVDSSSAMFVEVENATTEEAPAEDTTEGLEVAAPRGGQPQSDAQRLAALVRSKMEEDGPLSESRLSYLEDSGHGQPPPSPTNNPDLSIHTSDLLHIDSVLEQDNTRGMEATVQLRKRLSLRSRMRKLSILTLHRKEKGSGS